MYASSFISKVQHDIYGYVTALEDVAPCSDDYRFKADCWRNVARSKEEMSCIGAVVK